eukprot:Blabericola_migrator_1__70@NODE_1018_length_5684_cov_169_427630_g699_i0_p1_GENE_NODE_1018_length_5684_cov_169_427630_g699_i0NODE_1018_length_5684_cov_169_427630_g699_i0_p1_ORF_typecomplete_len800_score102_50_NODE_1018_length_5684_cov_169_427630_g699_i04112810
MIAHRYLEATLLKLREHSSLLTQDVLSKLGPLNQSCWIQSLLTTASFLTICHSLRSLSLSGRDWEGIRSNGSFPVIDVEATLSGVLPSVSCGSYHLKIKDPDEKTITRKYMSLESTHRRWLHQGFRKKSLKIWDRASPSVTMQDHQLPEVLFVPYGPPISLTVRIHRPSKETAAARSIIPHRVWLQPIIDTPVPTPPPAVEVWFDSGDIGYSRACLAPHVTLVSTQRSRSRALSFHRAHSIQITTLVRDIPEGQYRIGLRLNVPRQLPYLRLGCHFQPPNVRWSTLVNRDNARDPNARVLDAYRSTTSVWSALTCTNPCNTLNDCDTRIIPSDLSRYCQIHDLVFTAPTRINPTFSLRPFTAEGGPIVFDIETEQLDGTHLPVVIESLLLQRVLAAPDVLAAAHVIKSCTHLEQILTWEALVRKFIKSLVRHSDASTILKLGLMQKRFQVLLSEPRLQYEIMKTWFQTLPTHALNVFSRRHQLSQGLVRGAHDVLQEECHFVHHPHAEFACTMSRSPLVCRFRLPPGHYQPLVILRGGWAKAQVSFNAIPFKGSQRELAKWEATPLHEDLRDSTRCQQWRVKDTITLPHTSHVELEIASDPRTRFERLELLDIKSPQIHIPKMRLYERRHKDMSTRLWVLSPSFVCPTRSEQDLKDTSLSGVVAHGHPRSGTRGLKFVLKDVPSGCYKAFVIALFCLRRHIDSHQFNLAAAVKPKARRYRAPCCAFGPGCRERKEDIVKSVSQVTCVCNSLLTQGGSHKYLCDKPIYVPPIGGYDVYITFETTLGRETIDVIGLEPDFG